MEAYITQKKESFVEICTDLGRIWGIWRSPAPAELRKYIIELDSSEILTVDTDKITDYAKPTIKFEDDTVYLNGFVEEVQDNILILRLSNSIMMLQISNKDDFSSFVNKFVCVELQNISFYDTGIY